MDLKKPAIYQGLDVVFFGTLLANATIMEKLDIGKKVPSFTLLNQSGEKVKLSDYKGKKLLIYFYPKANTPGCTRQSCSVSEAMPKLDQLSIKSVGISPDNPEAQKRFDEKFNLGFPLLSDVDHKVARAFGAWGSKTSFGKTKEGIIRSSFLVDESGKLIKAWYRVKPEDTVPKALQAMEAI